MPTQLPLHPNLEHLKKQARVLLRDFRLKNPQAAAKFSALHLKGAPRLSDAQHLIARDYGFDSWPELKKHVETITAENAEAARLACKAFAADDPAAVRRLLEQYPRLRKMINDPVGDFDSPPVVQVRSGAVLDVLLEAGADINARSSWWAGGFGLLDSADPELAAVAIQRGATITPHAAARLGMLETLKELIEANPALVHAPGGDGQTPLHFASTIDVAEYLLDRGANIDALDIDHESTPAQYMVRTRPKVARYLIRRGCRTDILMTAALGDTDLVRSHLENDPECIRMRVSDEYFPMVGGRNGGTIYQWELGWYVSACQVAKSFGHLELFHFLMDQSPAEEKLLNACWLHDEGLVHALLAENAGLSAKLSSAGRRHLAHAARNNDTSAARLMLLAGLPVDAYSQHHATALHWSAWHGNAELAGLILARHPPLENADNEFKGTPLRWAIHGSENSWHRKAGDYGATVEALLKAGAKPTEKSEGSEAVKAVLGRSR